MLTRFSIRHSLFAIILLIALTAIMAMVMSAKQYEDFIHEIEKTAIEDLIELKANDLHVELVNYSTELGMVLQKEKGLRRAIKNKDISATIPFLNDHFHQYFVTAGVISLQKIYLLDKNFQHIAQSSDGLENIGLDKPLCANAIPEAKQRKGSNRLKVISRLCRADQLSLLSVIVPIGTLRPIGYLQIVTDPSYNAHQISKNLNMPIQVKQINGKINRTTLNWPTGLITDNYIFVDYDVKSKDSNIIYKLSAAKNVIVFKDAFRHTTLLVLSYSVPLVLLGLILAFYISKKGLRALNSLSHSAKETSEGKYKKINQSGYRELDQVIDSFNRMVDKIQNNQLILKQEVDSATKQLRDAMQLVETRNQELQTTIDLVEKANTTKSSFLANMSHELRTPLNAVIGYSEMLSEDLEDSQSPELVDDVNKIHTAGIHLLSLVNDILDLSKIEAGKLELTLSDIDLNATITETINTVVPMANNNGNELIVELLDPPESIHSDAMRLKQIILNIINNAVKFTNNGKIHISLRADVYLDNEVFYIEVKDSGIGIKQELIGKLFQPFYQADESATRKFGGTGLGLALSKQLIEGLGGDIKVESVVNQGSTFTIRLPKKIYA